MDNTERFARRLPDDALVRLLAFLVIPTLLGIVHHVDHVVRGNHVGWPLIPQVTPFTFSLAIYPLLAVGLYLTVTERASAGYWAAVLTASTVLLTAVHVGPWAAEPPAHVVGPYASPAVGYVALAVVVGLIVTVAAGSGYALVLWYRGGR
jgi:hypothetical protein